MPSRAGTPDCGRPSRSLIALEAAKTRLKRPLRSALRRAGYELQAINTLSEGALANLIRAAEIDLVLDVGANQGQYAQKLRALGYVGEILSFEPQREAFKRLVSSAAEDPRWSARRVALGSQTRTEMLHVSANSVSSSLLPMAPGHVAAAPSSAVMSREMVKVRRLDELLFGDERYLSRISQALLKIDVQGYEMDVLVGSGALLQVIPALQVEVSFQELYEGQPVYFELLEFLASFGFVPWSVDQAFSDPRTGQILQADISLIRWGP